MLAPPPENSLHEIIDPVTYGLDDYNNHDGMGVNLLRTDRIAQPRALKVGDILGNGDRVLAPPREGYNGVVWVLLSGGLHGHWIKLPSRIPVALLVFEDGAPTRLVREMQV